MIHICHQNNTVFRIQCGTEFYKFPKLKIQYVKTAEEIIKICITWLKKCYTFLSPVSGETIDKAETANSLQNDYCIDLFFPQQSITTFLQSRKEKRGLLCHFLSHLVQTVNQLTVRHPDNIAWYRKQENIEQRKTLPLTY